MPRPRVRRPGRRHVRVALLIALFALIVAGAAYGLSGIVGSSHGGAAQGEAWLGLEVVAPPVGGGLVAIAQVEPGSPAERAGLRPGDVITEIGGVPVTNPDDVHALIQGRRPGHQVEVGIQRGGVRIVQQITLAPRP